MTAGDLLIVVLLLGAAAAGARAGVVRGAGAAVGIVLVLLAGLWLRFPIAAQLGRLGADWTPARSEMLALLVLLGAGWVAIAVYAAGQGDRSGLRVLPGALEPAGGALLGVVAALLALSAIEVALAIGTHGGDLSGQGSDLVADAYRGLRATAIGTALHRTVITDLGGLVAPLLPIGTRMAIGIP